MLHKQPCERGPAVPSDWQQSIAQPLECFAHVIALCGMQSLTSSDLSDALASEEAAGFGAEKVVQLDTLVVLACLVCSGSIEARMQLALWALDRWAGLDPSASQRSNSHMA